MMMFRPNKDKVVSFDTAVLAKEKGFDWDTLFYHSTFNGKRSPDDIERGYTGSGIPACQWNKGIKDGMSEVQLYSAPTQSLLQKWLRDVHKIYVSIDEEHIMRWFYTIYYTYSPDEMIELDLDDLNIMNDEFESYEEALEQGLIEALKIIK